MAVSAADAIRPEQQRIVLCTHSGQALLRLSTFFIELCIAGTKDDKRTCTVGQTFTHHTFCQCRRYRNDTKLNLTGYINERTISDNALHFVKLWMNRVDAPLVVVAKHVVEWPTTDAYYIFRCTDNGNTLRCEKRSEISQCRSSSRHLPGYLPACSTRTAESGSRF